MTCRILIILQGYAGLKEEEEEEEEEEEDSGEGEQD